MLAVLQGGVAVSAEDVISVDMFEQGVVTVHLRDTRKVRLGPDSSRALGDLYIEVVGRINDACEGGSWGMGPKDDPDDDDPDDSPVIPYTPKNRLKEREAYKNN